MSDVIGCNPTVWIPVVAMIGLGYFVFFVWKTINDIEETIEESHMTLIKLIDQIQNVG